jgi:flagella basal body P-ring formation protein FlgA
MKIKFLITIFLYQLTFNVFALEVSKEIKLKKNVDIWGEKICLQQIVVNPAQISFCENENTNCCWWSFSGKNEIEIPLHELYEKIKKKNIEGIQFKTADGNSKININKVAVEISSEEIKSILKTKLTEKFSETISPSNKSEIKGIYVKTLFEKNWDILIDESQTGIFNARVIEKNNPLNILSTCNFTAQIKKTVLIPIKKIPPQTTVTINQFEKKEKEIPFIPGQIAQIVNEENFPIGGVSRVTLDKDHYLTLDNVLKKNLVRSGEMITLILHSDNLKLSTKGVAQGSGGLGDMISVQLPKYNRSFRGRLSEGNIVEVWL